MRRTRIAAVATAGALAAAGTGVAVATSSDDAKDREQAVLEDAAGRLDVSPDELRDALGAAQDAQLDAEVKAGRITQEQADAIKAMRDRSGLVLGGPGRGPHGPGFGVGGDHRGGPGEVIGAAADALGLSEQQLFDRLRNGRSLQQIAKAQGKDYADVKAAVRSAVKTELDAAVDAGRLTRAQADEMLEHLTEHLDEGRIFGGRGGPGGPGFHGPPPGGDDGDGAAFGARWD